MRTPPIRRLCALAASLVATAAGAADGARYSDAGPEPMLARAFEEIEANRMDDALRQVEALTKAYPTFRLGHLIEGDLLLARAKPLATIGNADNAPPGRLADLRAEAVARLRAYRDRPPANYVPRYLVQMRPDQKYAIVVDTQKSRLYVYQNDNGTPRFVADYYVTQGKLGSDKLREGDKKTPIGVYHVTSSLPLRKLGRFYGSGAYPISYPNEWDRRMGRKGHGIWLHGTPPDTFSRPPRDSDGCVVLANRDLDAVAKTLQIGLTPVIISNSIEWLSLDDWQSERTALTHMIDEWRSDWESRDVARYASHYSKRFRSDDENYSQWIEHKRRIAAGKTWIKVTMRNLSMFRDPGKEDMVVVTFEQDYQSNNLANRMEKRQYWIKEDGRWKIIYEGGA